MTSLPAKIEGLRYRTKAEAFMSAMAEIEKCNSKLASNGTRVQIYPFGLRAEIEHIHSDAGSLTVSLTGIMNRIAFVSPEGEDGFFEFDFFIGHCTCGEMFWGTTTPTEPRCYEAPALAIPIIVGERG